LEGEGNPGDYRKLEDEPNDVEKGETPLTSGGDDGGCESGA